jgi:hypothetical protein
MKERLIYLYLYLRTKIKIFINMIMNYMFKIKRVDIKLKNNTTSAIFRYYLINWINSVISYIEYIRDLVDIKCDKIQITSRSFQGDKITIVDSKKLGHDVSLNEMNNHIQHHYEKQVKLISGHILTKLELHYKDDKICLKKYVEMYKEITKKGHHTLENIMHFNKIKFDPNSKIVVEYFDNGKMVITDYKIKDIYDKHINNIVKIED